jgi:glutamate racemase
MKNNPIIFIDSGIGGIPYCRDFLKRNPQETVFYLADRENFPYGPRSKEELIFLLAAHIEKLKPINPKIFVLACNTASVAALSYLRQNFPQFVFVGTVPAVKPAANACRSGRIGVLGSSRTIEDIRSMNIEGENESSCKNRCEISGIAAPELVDFVERRFEKASGGEKTEIVKKYISLFRAENVDTLVLGCTHFLYLLEEFRREASPFIKVFDSLDGITKRIEYLLDENNGTLRAEKGIRPEYCLLLTGTQPADILWQERAAMLGFKLRLLKDI